MSINLMGDTSPAPTPEDAQLAALFPSMAAKLDTSTTPVVEQASPAVRLEAERDNAEMAATLYPNMCSDATRAIENAAMELDALTPEQAKEVSESWQPHFQALQLSATEASTLAELGIAAHQSPPDEATALAWADEAKAALAREYGRENVGQLLADVKRMIARHPALHGYLARSGLGNHPKVVAMGVAKARALKARGKL